MVYQTKQKKVCPCFIYSILNKIIFAERIIIVPETTFQSTLISKLLHFEISFSIMNRYV